MPKISVIMSVYNEEKFLGQAVQSILDQSLADFEFIVINDGSTDDSLNILRRFHDARLKIISRENRGLVYSLNEACRLARGKYIARMDGDDIAEPDRLALQWDFLEAHPELSICGSWAIVIDESGEEFAEYKYPPLKSEDIKKYALWHNPFIHPTVMFRRSLLNEVGPYNLKFKHIEDYELWTRVLAGHQGANLPEYLLQYRLKDKGITRSKNCLMRFKGLGVRFLAFKRLRLGWCKKCLNKKAHS